MSEEGAVVTGRTTLCPSPATNGPNVWRFEQWAEEITRTREKPCFWVAECMDELVGIVMRRRYGVANAMARELLAMGMPDGPLEVVTRGTGRTVRWGSLYAAARHTCREGNKPIYCATYREVDFGAMRDSMP